MAFLLPLIAIICIWYIYSWYVKRLKKHNLVYVKSEFNERIISLCPRMVDYKLPFAFANPVIHSVASSGFREHVDGLPKFHRREILLTCGARVSVDFSTENFDRKKNTLLLLHGITGHSMASYNKHMVKEALRRGFQCALMNNRGCGGTQLGTAVSFNAARTSDLREVVNLLRNEYLDAETPLYIIAFSMGGTILIRFLAEERLNTNLINGAVAVSTNFNMDHTALYMERPYSFAKNILNRSFAKRMIFWFRNHEHVFRENPDINVDKVYLCRTLREYDQLVNIPTSEFESVEEYYAACSTDDKVGLVKCPLLCIQSEDDPVCLAASIPVDVFRVNPNIILNIVPSGGHVGFLERFCRNSPSWIEDCAMDFFEAIGQARDQSKMI